ncbi:MAG: 5-(carboxyamino)imidazole ribonucleotide mutase [Gammaproteobacteria bacterium]|nr:5-(carboxyamino)imidazole ribonucleotide mutase [Gammaproteobacteria bacterium]MYF03042.1 5-(carboxyamino)imidazole ribonucleotide mutase [Gammaproteobacteria bacterium]
MSLVAILMGSRSDWPKVRGATTVLREFGVPFEVKVTSAHRTPKQTAEYVGTVEENGCQVFICAAGVAAHLAGAVAAHTTKPVIGIPVDGGPLNGFDALLSTVQMPGGVPVATVAIGSAGAKNAGYLAVQILALTDAMLAQKLQAERATNVTKIAADNQEVQRELES